MSHLPVQIPHLRNLCIDLTFAFSGEIVAAEPVRLVHPHDFLILFIGQGHLSPPLQGVSAFQKAVFPVHQYERSCVLNDYYH